MTEAVFEYDRSAIGVEVEVAAARAITRDERRSPSKLISVRLAYGAAMFPISDVIPSRTRPVVTIGLIALNALAFLYQWQLDDLAMRRFVFQYGVIPARFSLADVVTSMFLHADLFRDNALFEGSHLTGVIDFYNACSGPMLYDLAISVNDWCSDADGHLDPARTEALLGAYSARRRFHPAEAELWPTMLRVACLRFWLSRLIAAEENRGRDVLIKDPDEFRRLLARRQQVDSALPFAL